MEQELEIIASRLRDVRIAKDLKQADVDQGAELPANTFSKVERHKRELTASEFLRVTRFLGVTSDAILTGEGSFIYREEIKVIEALRAIPFEDYKRILSTLEAQVYFAQKDAPESAKPHLLHLVDVLTQLRQSDQRPRINYSEVKRVRNENKQRGQHGN